MMNFDDTIRVLMQFYFDCQLHHIREKNDGVTAHKLALQDIKSLRHNPYTPKGEKLNTEAHSRFIETMANG